ncbi:MAG: hypothetical protein QM731_02815 [Chitinophagaceae bacterium]
MLTALKSLGTPLSRNDMKQLSGGSAPAAKQYRCTKGEPYGYVNVCVGGGANPIYACPGFILCDYISTCSPGEETCGVGGEA